MGKLKKYRIVPTPYHWSRTGGSWRIGYGASSFLIAEGSGYSAPVGMRLLKQLQAEYRKHGAGPKAKAGAGL